VDEADKDHDKNLMKLLGKSRNVSLKINGPNGIKVDPRKVESMTTMPPPTSVPELRRFLGMVQYLSKFLSELSYLTKPLRKLTEDEVKWSWIKEMTMCSRKCNSVK